MRIHLLFCLGLCLSGANLSAQTGFGKISGSVKDIQEKKLEGMSVSLLKAKDSSLVKMALSNREGQFEFEKIAAGNYLVSLSGTGYASWFSRPLEVSSSNPVVTTGEITLPTSTGSLAEVTVLGKRPLIENKIDKTIVNVDASISNAGNSAMEVLEKSPNISVDKDGNITMKGKQGVIILIDGKQTYLGGADLVNLLKNTPASQLDQIELMSQPSAKYDASGNAGIINIKTKRSQQKGFNASVTLSYIQAVYPKSPNSLNWNYRNGKFNVYGNYSFSYWEGFSQIGINRHITDQEKNTHTLFAQTSNLHFQARTHNFKTGVDFLATEKNSFGFSVTGLIDKRESDVSTTSNLFDMDQNGKLGSTSIAYTRNTNPWMNAGMNLNFRRQIDKKGRELTADLDYLVYDTKSIQQSDNYTYNPDGSLDTTNGAINPYLLHGNLPSVIRIYTGKADYTHPLKNNGKIEAGWKSSYVKTDNDAQYSYLVNSSPVVDTNRTNRFLYDENINALYANYNQQVGKWGLQAGLRMEQTHARGNQVVKNQRFDTSYVQFFPSMFLSYTMNDKNQFSLSYGRRIDRPNYQDMNPFQYFLDQYTYRQGNPNLRPQFSHNIELSYNFKGELNLSANYTYIDDVINDILKQNDSSKVTYQTKENVSNQTNIGLSISYNKQLTKWWTISVSGNVFNNHYWGIVNDTYLDVSMTSFLANLSSQFRFGKGWGGEISGFYNSKELATGMIVAEPMKILSFAFSKQVLHEKGTLKLNLRDPFYIMKFNGYTKFGNIDFNVHSRWDNRRVALTFTYRFGKTMNNLPQRKKGSSSDEQNRVGGAGNGQQ